MKKIIISTLFFALVANSFAQEKDFANMMSDPGKSLFEVQAAFEKYFEGKDRTEKGKGFKAFKRWEYMRKFRVDQNGMMPDPSIAYLEYKKFKSNPSNQRISGSQQVFAAGDWTYVGPSNGVPTNGGAGRLNFVTFDPNNTNTIYVGAPAGGLWKTTDGGQTWSTNTDELSVIGMSDLAIDPINPQIMYLGTGDRDANDTYSVGILKSTDGGQTWNPTGLLWTITLNRTVSKILIDPTNTNVIIAATSFGIYRSLDAGNNWTLEKSGSFKDMKFKPGDPTTIYATGTGFFRSTDNGDNWTQISSGFTSNVSFSRMALAVTPADPNYVYVLASAADYGHEGIYRSTNSGATFTQRSSSPNILGWSTTGNDQGGQGWYDLTIACSPTNKDFIVTGGVNIWKSTNGGTSMQLMAHWYGGGGAPYVHADIHMLDFLPGSGTTIFAACDGGLFKSSNSGSSWIDLSDSPNGQGLHIGQMYKLGVSNAPSNPNLTITGWQDNGTSVHNSATGAANYVLGGDGMECIIDYVNPNIMYGELYYGDISRSTNGGASWNNIVSSGGSGVDEDGDWVTPYIMHPTVNTTLLVGKSTLYRSTNSGNTWTTFNLPNLGSNITNIAYSRSNPSYIYAVSAGQISFTTNGGTSFTTINGPGGTISYIAVDPNNPQKIYVTTSGYSAGSKVFVSTNSGTTWTNISHNLPNVPANCIALHPGSSNGGLYVGTDIGVFYYDTSINTYVMYSSMLPNVIVTELEVQVATNKIRAATYGRGLWECDLYSVPTTKPTVAFSSNRTSVCQNASVDFYDNSSNFPTTWQWSFPGGNPSTSNLPSPSVTYTVSGLHPVKLVVANQAGQDSLEIVSYINVLSAPVAFAGLDRTLCKGDTAQLLGTGGNSFAWAPALGLSNATVNNPVCNSTITRTYTLTVNDANGCIGTDQVKITVIPQPSTPVVLTYNVDSLYTISLNVNYQWSVNGNIIPNSNSRFVNKTNNGPGVYAVTVTDTANCGFSASSANFNVVGIEDKNQMDAQIQLAPNPSNGNFMLNTNVKVDTKVLLTIQNVLGQTVYSESFDLYTGKQSKNIQLNTASGIYDFKIKDLTTGLEISKKLTINRQ